MILGVECLIICMIFTIIVLPAQYKDPVRYIMSYPPEIRKRVESLPQYKNSIQNKETEHIWKKIIAVLVFSVTLSAVAWFSGAKSFHSAFFHVFILFLAVNSFDTLVLDIGIFCHSKKLRIPGTEDMDREYKNYLFHIWGGFKGIIIGTVVSLLSACIVYMISLR